MVTVGLPMRRAIGWLSPIGASLRPAEFNAHGVTRPGPSDPLPRVNG